MTLELLLSSLQSSRLLRQHCRSKSGSLTACNGTFRGFTRQVALMHFTQGGDGDSGKAPYGSGQRRECVGADRAGLPGVF